MHHLKSAAFVIPALIVFQFVSPARADRVFRWTDDQGNVHYSSTAPVPGAKPADLPEINRAEMKLKLPEVVSCSQHGGIDCQAGADGDGSVLCVDGFSGATARYRFSCSSPKLSIAEIGEPDDKGEVTVYVRNSKSVSAANPAMLYKDPQANHEVKLDGPEEIEPFGVAEFKLKPLSGIKPSLEELRLTCANCP